MAILFRICGGIRVFFRKALDDFSVISHIDPTILRRLMGCNPRLCDLRAASWGGPLSFYHIMIPHPYNLFHRFAPNGAFVPVLFFLEYAPRLLACFRFVSCFAGFFSFFLLSIIGCAAANTHTTCATEARRTQRRSP